MNKSTLNASIDFSKLSILITGGAGFIGSHLVDYFIQNNSNEVRILDNFSTGHEKNIQHHLTNPKLRLIKGDIRDLQTCQNACNGVDIVLHQAAFNSVPRSINDPVTTTQVNIDGMVNMLKAAADNKVKRFVYASSSSVYGTNIDLPKVESNIGKPLSPYALTKATGEQFANLYSTLFSLPTVGLRYFNVFGPRQNPDGDYAAFIPRLIRSFITGSPLEIFGDGEQSRDFTYINNVVQANVLAAFSSDSESVNKVYNVALGHTISLNQLVDITRKITLSKGNITYANPRIGDIKDSMADISLAKKLLHFEPNNDFENAYTATFEWFKNNLTK